ncbi:(2Fe-2S)-binding protein [Streptosporangium longisporum]|uniref:(2Fe-2S)-binding protein n=1 Tax=Streptosporangium longisporum TaxID=46187 RepID=UPI0031F159CE
MTARRAAIVVDGRVISAVEGVTLAAALVGERHWTLGRNPVDGALRGPFCGMGVCFECEVTVDGRAGVRACLTRIHPGMRVDTAAPAEGSDGG